MSSVVHMIDRVLCRLPELHIGIIGDFCLDAYFEVDMSASETSVETALATLPVVRQRYSLGGAGNVAANLKAIGVGTVRCFGVCGNDPFGHQIRRIMADANIEDNGLIVQECEWDTHVFTKVLIGEKEQPRLDFGNFNHLHGQTAELLISNLESWITELDLLVINQQVLRGIHCESFRKRLVSLMARYSKPLSIVDSRSHSSEFSTSIRKINEREAAVLCGNEPSPKETITMKQAREYGVQLHHSWNKPLFLTRGERGCLVFEAERCTEIPGLLLVSQLDTVGAGDSFLAGAAAALATGNSLQEAARFGTMVAGVTVQKQFVTGTASPQEIRTLAGQANYRYHPELAVLPQKARYVRECDIEIVDRLPSTRDITHAIFDNDGTISTLRQGWEDVMEPVMIRSILGERWREIGETTFRQVQERVRNYIDRTTGLQTLVQMVGLVKMVREFGVVPKRKILTEHGYKAMYNRALMKLVNRRIEKIRRGELSVSDFTLKGAVEFLRALHRRGILLYLASGTDQEDVVREAEILDYAGLFEDRIYGAIGDISHEPKRKVLELILNDVDLKEHERILTFGDGPVEIQETRKRAGIAVGVASDEVRRWGLNSVKRSRLIQAGAHLIVSDFSQFGKLLEFLFPEIME